MPRIDRHVYEAEARELRSGYYVEFGCIGGRSVGLRWGVRHFTVEALGNGVKWIREFLGI